LLLFKFSILTFSGIMRLLIGRYNGDPIELESEGCSLLMIGKRVGKAEALANLQWPHKLCYIFYQLCWLTFFVTKS
jgi:hypothetical protein